MVIQTKLSCLKASAELPLTLLDCAVLQGGGSVTAPSISLVSE